MRESTEKFCYKFYPISTSEVEDSYEWTKAEIAR